MDDETLVRDVPATTPIFLEKQLEDWITFVKSFVVPDEAVEWIDGEDTLRTREALSYRTAKKHQTIKKAPATEEHPEQVDVVTGAGVDVPRRRKALRPLRGVRARGQRRAPEAATRTC